MAGDADITTSTSYTLRLFFFSLVFFSDLCVRARGTEFGIHYGQIANNLRPPSPVAALLGSINISRVKLYDADPGVLAAFLNTNVEFIVGLGNEYLENTTDHQVAQDWIQQHLL